MSGDGGSMRQDALTPAVWARALLRLDVKRRARVLGRLLGLLGPLALAAVAGGAFVKYVRFARRRCVPVSLDDAAGATESEVHELVRYVQQSHPGFLRCLDHGPIVSDVISRIATSNKTTATLSISAIHSWSFHAIR